jgi:hypothetical protein
MPEIQFIVLMFYILVSLFIVGVNAFKQREEEKKRVSGHHSVVEYCQK